MIYAGDGVTVENMQGKLSVESVLNMLNNC